MKPSFSSSNFTIFLSIFIRCSGEETKTSHICTYTFNTHMVYITANTVQVTHMHNEDVRVTLLRKHVNSDRVDSDKQIVLRMTQAGFIKSALCTVGSYTYVDYDSMAMKSQFHHTIKVLLHRGVQHSLAWFGIVVTVMLPLHRVVLNHVSMQGAVGASIALVVRVS